ncbi:MAG: T9SS type A sorting domain-containing protein [Bacteroidales bacterium]
MRKIIFLLSFLLVSLSGIQAQEWIQIGNNVEGEMSGDQLGYSVSLSADGLIMVVGAPYNDDAGLNAGHAKVYENQSGIWTQIGQNINGEAEGDNFGIAVSISSDGSVVAVGARNNDGNGSSAGHVRVYEYVSGSWTQIGQDIDGEAAFDRSGSSISLSSDGSVIAIGAYGNDGVDIDAGHVRVYENLSGTWTQIGQDIDGEATNDNFGESVSLSSDGSVVAIGGSYNDNSFLDAGHVEVYENQSGIWTQVGQDIEGTAEEDYFGASVSLSSDGSILAAGAIGKNNFSGSVRVYENQSGTWTQIGQDIDGEGDYSEFGGSVCLSSDGSLVANGAPYYDSKRSDAGLVSVYENQSGTWTQIGQTIHGAAAGDEFGASVSLSSDGEILAAGSPLSDSNESNVGHAGVFELYNPITIINQPEDRQNICPDSNVSFTVTGENIESYQWQVDEGGGFIDIANGAVYSNANTATLDISGVTIGMNNHQYRCVLTNPVDNVTSDVALLTTDFTIPEITCVGNQEFNADDTHFYTVQGAELDPTATFDNCEVESLINDFNNSSSLADAQIPEGTTTIIWTITDNSGNENTCSFDVEVSPYVGVEDFSENEISVYPSPFSNQLTIDPEGYNGEISFEIFNALGQLILKDGMIEKTTIQTSNFRQGIYLIKLKKGDTFEIKKIIKE